MKPEIKRVVEFLKDLEVYYHTTVMFHNDCDGVCSAALLMRFLRSEYGLDVHSIYSPIARNYFLKNLQRVKTNSLILVDLACEKYGEVVNLSRKVKILLLDHHRFLKDLNSSNLVHLNTKMISDRYYPASKLVYDLISKIKDIKNLKWIAAAGTIADKGYRSWKDFIDKTYKDFDLKKEDLFTIPRIIGSAISMNKTEEALENLMEIGNPKEFLEGPKTKELRKCYIKMEKELKRIVEKVGKEELGESILLELSTDYNIRSLVATTLEDRYQKNVIILQLEPEVAALSLRGKNSLKLAEQVSKGIPNARFGGHPKASGVKFPKDYVSVIKKRVSDLLKSKWIQIQ